jgi:hypothetical protein
MAGRDTPPDLQDSPDYSTLKRGNKDKGPATISRLTKDENRIKLLARECWDSSTNWLNAGRRLAWSESLRAFQGLHPSNSKYLSTDYRYRSRLFRPKTRAMVRMAEAQAASAFFGNEDVCSITANDDDNQLQQASAEILKSLLQFRLTKTIPWFLTCCGGRQDAEVMGIAIAKAYWKFQEKFTHTESRPVMHPVTGESMVDPETGEPLTEDYDIYQTITDHPWIDLMAPENFRFDPGADWRNPIATSPYTIECIPMYLCDIKQKIKDDEWYPVSDGSLRAATDLDDDTTRRSREQGRVPGKDHDAWKPKEYDICWVRENIMRIDGEDMHCYTLGSAGEMLSKPRPLKEVYLHGIRPYVCGFVMPEAHKTYPSSKVELVKDLQTQANDVSNLRLDNVKLALNPRQFVRDGKAIDPTDVRSFQPGKVIMVKDPEMDIKWDRPPEVTASSYQEQDRINLDFDDLTGATSNSSIQANKGVYEAVGNMEMMAGNASQIGEYEQRTWAETFVEPLLTHIVKLEQAYETDEIVLANAGRQAKLFQKFGMNEITDELLQQDLTCKVNVGIGATNPQKKLQNFSMAMEMIGKIYGEAAAMVSNPEEVMKEIFANCGYKDGDRFVLPGSDIHAIMQQQAQQKSGGKGGGDPQKLQAVQMQNQGKMQQIQLQNEGDLKQAQLELQKTALQEQMESEREKLRLTGDLVLAHHGAMNEQNKMVIGHQQSMQQSSMQNQHQAQQSQIQHQQNQQQQSAQPQKAKMIYKYDKKGKRVGVRS